LIEEIAAETRLSFIWKCFEPLKESATRGGYGSITRKDVQEFKAKTQVVCYPIISMEGKAGIWTVKSLFERC